MILFQSPQWGNNSKVEVSEDTKYSIEFQSPQWGNNSKAHGDGTISVTSVFQSPQWGNNSKECEDRWGNTITSFSPRNGEIILKFLHIILNLLILVSVPAMGK